MPTRSGTKGLSPNRSGVNTSLAAMLRRSPATRRAPKRVNRPGDSQFDY